MVSISTPSLRKSTCRRTRCSCCSKVCSMPHKQSACCCSAKFGTCISQLDQWVCDAERSNWNPWPGHNPERECFLCTWSDVHQTGLVTEFTVEARRTRITAPGL